MPLLVLVAGLNGAGKTTFVQDRLRHFPAFRELPVVNPDTIAAAQHISPAAAGRTALQARRTLLDARRSFAVETTLSGHSEVTLVQRAKAAGYAVWLFYVGLANLRLNYYRIEERVADGGHFVQVSDVVRRAPRSAENFRRLRPCADRLWLFDNSGLEGFRCLREEKSGTVVFQTEKLPRWAAELLREA